MFRRKIVAVSLLLAVATAGTACGSDSKSSDASATKPDKAAFCRTSAKIDAATANIQSNDDAVAAFTKAQADVHLAVREAPADIAADVKVVAAAIDEGLKTKDFSAFQDGTLDAHTKRLDSYCK